MWNELFVGNFTRMHNSMKMAMRRLLTILQCNACKQYNFYFFISSSFFSLKRRKKKTKFVFKEGNNCAGNTMYFMNENKKKRFKQM